jgi:hypothetical protein
VPLAVEPLRGTDEGQQGAVLGWRYDLEGAGGIDWTHASQLLRVERIAEKLATGEHIVGNRQVI